MLWDGNSREAQNKIQEELCSSKLRETEAAAEVTVLRHRFMELEAQVSDYYTCKETLTKAVVWE